MKSLKRFKDPEKAQRYRNNSRKRYYHKHRYGGGQPWTETEDKLLFQADQLGGDIAFAKYFRRSLSAIQKRRWLLKCRA